MHETLDRSGEQDYTVGDTQIEQPTNAFLHSLRYQQIQPNYTDMEVSKVINNRKLAKTTRDEMIELPEIRRSK